MKLISAKFTNFRMLKDLVLDFSTSDRMPLTVIRAANETGKTTSLTGLMWCFFGEEALPRRGRSRSTFVLFPADEASINPTTKEISVEIVFEVEKFSSNGAAEAGRMQYKLKRSVHEQYLSPGVSERAADTMQMQRITPEGFESIDQPEARRIIENALPFALKDVYFTDGDSAMSFIEASATDSAKRTRVSKAIESLLGLHVLDKTVKDVEAVRRDFSKSIDNTDYQAERELKENKIDFYNGEIEEADEEINEAEGTAKYSQGEIDRLDSEIEEILKKGDKEQLAKERNEIKRRINSIQEASQKSLGRLSKFSYSKATSKMMMQKTMIKGMAKLNELASRKQLPKANIPILEELLERIDCFCGSDIRSGTPEGDERRSHILKTINASAESDRVQEIATSLFYRVRSDTLEGVSETWMNTYEELYQDFHASSGSVQTLEDKLTDIQSKIDSIEDSDLEERRILLKQHRKAYQDATSTIVSQNARKSKAKEWVEELEHDRSALLRREGKNDTSGQKALVASTVKDVFSEIISQLKGEELRKVSKEMKRIFIEMIGASPDDNDFTLITSAELTDDFEIVVYGAGGHKLNPDEDLNGASRRAITLAFILALTKVSQVEAPNVIDTPLGMMAGYVKQSCLLQTLKEGSQAILFLTHDEIKGVESIINDYAGKVFTLTNPAHYPKMLLNRPPVSDSRIVRCECGIDMTCDVCIRKELEIQNER